MSDPGIRDGWFKCPAYGTGFAEVYTNGTQIVVLGEPPEPPDGEDLLHNCDQMGCGWDHVLIRINAPEELLDQERRAEGAEDG